MRREGHQHGMVRAHRILPNLLNPRPDNRLVNRFNSPTTAKLFIRVPSKPTNHSKFTGKCGQPWCNGCHLHPTCKAKGKTKGNQKLKASNLVSNHKLFDFRGVDVRPGLKFSGVSAARILDQLSSYHVTDDDEISDYDGDDDQVYNYDGPYSAKQ